MACRGQRSCGDRVDVAQADDANLNQNSLRFRTLTPSHQQHSHGLKRPIEGIEDQSQDFQRDHS